MVDSFGQTQSIYAEESVNDSENGVKLRNKNTIEQNHRLNKLEQSLNSEVLQTLERDQEEISAIMVNQSPMLIQEDNHHGGIFKTAINRAQGVIH